MEVKTLPTRNEVPVELTWDLTTIYPTEEAWEADFARCSEYPAKLSAYKGRIRRSGRILLEYIKLSEECSQMGRRLYLYAHLHSDEDTANSHYQALVGRCKTLFTQLGAAMAWYKPELLTIKPERLAKWMDKVPGLALYKQDFDEYARQREHVCSKDVEQVLALAGEISSSASAIHGAIDNADISLPTVTGPDGNPVQLTHGNWAVMLDCKDREVRRGAFNAMFGWFDGFRNTLAATYAAQVKTDVFHTRARKYGSCIERALAGSNIPVSVYDNLVSTVHANLPLLQRYLELRKRILGVEQLEWYDLYLPLVDGVNDNIAYADAQETVLAALAPLGEEYVSALRDGFKSRWIDVVETKGKRSGAYHSGAWGCNPFMLLNWQATIDSMFTLAHEAGHAMHSWFSKRTQPYTYSGYTLFVAEVASTTNEQLLAHYLLQRTTDPKMRLYIINHMMESIRKTLVRQTLFAEFEREAHALAEAGKPLTADSLCKLHLELNEKYYGPVCHIDPKLGIEWARIPHFWTPFYVYQYATGISAAFEFAKKILNEGQPAVDAYIGNFLKAGSSDYSIDILQAAGVDLSSPAPVQAAFDAFAEYLKLFEEEFARL
jgi:oligoendopeptidase F